MAFDMEQCSMSILGYLGVHMHIHEFNKTMQSRLQIAVMILGQGTYYLTDIIFKMARLNSTMQGHNNCSIELHNGSYSQKEDGRSISVREYSPCFH